MTILVLKHIETYVFFGGSPTLRNPNQQLISIQELLRVNLENAQDQSQKAEAERRELLEIAVGRRKLGQGAKGVEVWETGW